MVPCAPVTTRLGTGRFTWLQRQPIQNKIIGSSLRCEQTLTEYRFARLFLIIVLDGLGNMRGGSPVHRHHSAILHRQALIPDHSLVFFMAFSTLLLKPSFSRNLSLHCHPSPGWSSGILPVVLVVVTGGLTLASAAD